MNIGKDAILEDFAVMLEWFDRVGYSGRHPSQRKSVRDSPHHARGVGNPSELGLIQVGVGSAKEQHWSGMSPSRSPCSSGRTR